MYTDRNHYGPGHRGHACHAPKIPFEPVKTRLVRELDESGGQAVKVLSIVAPTGFGKTVAMIQYFSCLRRIGEPCIWIRLEEYDNAMESLLHNLQVAVEEVVGANIDTEQPFGSSLGLGVGGVLAQLSRLPHRTTIFFDNLNSCTDPRLGKFLDALIFQTSDEVRFVWSSTIQLPISTTKAKLQSLIREVGIQQMKLSWNETRSFLGEALCNDIGLDGISTILEKTEGWAAGLRMARLILEDSANPLECIESFSGANQEISLLLGEQVLSAFRPPVMRFLLCASYFRIFSAEQLEFIMGDQHAESRLRFLQSRNAFIIPMDRTGRSFRMHQLFRDCLRNEADRVLSKTYRHKLFARASDWCLEQGEWQDAVQYAFETGCPERIAKALDKAAPALVRDLGKVHTFVEWVDRLMSDDAASIGVETQFWYVYSLIFHRRYANAELQYARLTSFTMDGAAPPESDGDEFRQRVDQLHVGIALLTDRLGEALVRAESWLASARPKDPFDVGWVHCIKSICLLTKYDFAEARKAQRESELYVREVGSPYLNAWCSLVRGTIELYAGNISVAYRDIMDSRAEAARALGDDAEMCDTMAAIASKCAMEMGLRDEASELVEHGLRSARLHGTVGTAGMAFDTALQLWDGKPENESELTRLRDIARSYPPRLAKMLSCHLARRLVALGRVDEAEAEACSIGLDMATGRIDDYENELPRCAELYAATAIDILVATGDSIRARASIQNEMRSAKTDGRIGRVIELELSLMVLSIQVNERAKGLCCTNQLMVEFPLALDRVIPQLP